jgi:hypothetical protein
LDGSRDPDDADRWEVYSEISALEKKMWTKRGSKVHVNVWDVVPRPENPGEPGLGGMVQTVATSNPNVH